MGKPVVGMAPGEEGILDEGVQQIDGWTVRLRLAEARGQPPILMLHGWTGNEDSMWVFASRFPRYRTLAAPRGLYPAQPVGYGWQDFSRSQGMPVCSFIPSVTKLLSWLNSSNFPGVDWSRFSVIGFSQGAALGYCLALLHPDRVVSLVGLAGFVPDDAGLYLQGQPLSGIQAFVAHGRKDELVSVEKARSSVEFLEKAGAQVSYCEDDVGHKLSVNCFKGLEAFLK